MSYDEERRALQEALERQRRFVADVAHELRTPLTSIQGNLDFLVARAELSLNRALADALRDMVRETDRLVHLVEDLLSLAQMDEGEALRVTRVDLETVAYGLYAVARAGAPSIIFDFSSTQAGTGDAIVPADDQKVRIALRNVLDNAVKYTPAGGTVQVAVSKDARGVSVRVADTGIGIAPQALSRIFDRFYREDRARAYSPGGTGLGLAIARSIALAHRGNLTVESKEGLGTTFTFWLPRCPAKLENSS